MASVNLGSSGYSPWFKPYLTNILFYLNRHESKTVIDLAIRSVAAAYTATNEDATILADASGGAFTVTLPKATTVPGRVITVKRMNSGANAVTVDGDGSETIDGSATASLASQYASVTVQSDGSNWIKL